MPKNTKKLFSATFCLFFQTAHLVAMINEDDFNNRMTEGKLSNE